MITNSEVLAMVKSGLSADVVITKIKSSRCYFNTEASILSELKFNGVPNEVIKAMIEAPYGAPRERPAAEEPERALPHPASQRTQNAEEIAVADGTEFTVTPVEEINSGQAVEGDAVVFRVVDDVMAGGRVAIARGALAKGTVSDVTKRGMLGKAGKLSVRIESVAAVDGQRVRLRASAGRAGGGNTGTVIALSILVTPLFLLIPCTRRGAWARAPNSRWAFPPGRAGLLIRACEQVAED